MPYTRRLSFLVRLRIMLTLLMLLCFETLSYDQLIFTCQPEPFRVTFTAGKCQKTVFDRWLLELPRTDHVCSIHISAKNTLNWQNWLKDGIGRKVFRRRETLPLYLHIRADFVRKPFSNSEEKMLNFTATAETKPGGNNSGDNRILIKDGDVNLQIIMEGEVNTSDSWRGLFRILPVLRNDVTPRKLKKYADVKNKFSWLDYLSNRASTGKSTRQTTDESDEEYGKEDGHQQKRQRLPRCACRCRPADRMKSGQSQMRPAPCDFELKRVFLLNGRATHRGPSSNRTRTTGSGKRYRSLQSRAWSVDVTPNPKGQAKRNNLIHQDQKADMDCLRSNNGNWSKSIVDLLLMLECQRTGTEGSGWGNILMRILVSIRVLAFLLGDRPLQKAGSNKRRLLPALRPSATDTRTLSIDKAKKKKSNNLYCSCYVVLTGRNAGEVSLSREACKGRENSCHLSCSKDKNFSNSDSQLTHVSGCVNEFRPDAILWVAPATGFLPSVTSRDGHFLDHTGYRLASLAALPASCNLSRVRLAGAGFHYDPRANSSAVVCHRCGAAYSLQPSSGQSVAPLEFHQSQSPQCPFLNSLLETYSTLPSAAPLSAVPGQAADSLTLSPASESSATTATASVSSPSRQVGESLATDGRRDLAVDCDAAGPGLTRNWPSTDSHRPSQRSQASTGRQSYTFALAGSALDQKNTTDAVASAVPFSSLQQPGAPSAPQNTDYQDRDERPQLSLGNAVYPQFSTAQSRLATFRNWPLNAIFPPHILVALGFYYAGYADCVRCFFCGVGLKSWDEQDDVLTEHIRWRPNCLFLLATKGRQFIQNTLNRIGNINNSSESDTSPSTLQRSTTSHNNRPATPNTSSLTPPPTTTLTTATSISSGQGSSASSIANRSRSGGRERGDCGTGQGQGQTGTEIPPDVRQQLITMGFSSEDITLARTSLMSAGEPCDLERLLERLLP